jgi:hypothetical protein
MNLAVVQGIIERKKNKGIEFSTPKNRGVENTHGDVNSDFLLTH